MPEYLPGAEASAALERQIAEQSQATMNDRVIGVEKVGGVFRVTTAQNGVQESLALLVATGATPAALDVPGAREMLNQGLGYSPTTHSHMVAGKHVAVIGTTVRALRGAAELARSAAQVYLIASEPAGLDTPLAQSLRQRTNVEVIEGYHVKQVNGPFNVESLVIERGDQHRWLRVDAAFIDLGLKPNSECVRKLVQTDAEGFIWVDERNATTLPGLYAAGDVTTAFGEQVLIAIGDGARAALSAYDYILAQVPAAQS